MARVGRPGLSDAQKREIWRRWKDEQSLSDIGRALGKVAGSIHNVVSANGGFVPAQRKRAAKALTFAEREEISRGLARQDSLRVIAARLGRPPSTISREVTRNGGRSAYRAAALTKRRGIALDGLNPVCCNRITDFGMWWRASLQTTGHPSRSRAGLLASTAARTVCMCPARPSIAACSSRRVVC